MTPIAGAEQLVAIFGYWPTFHDAEVVRFCLARSADFADGPLVEADVHVFEITDQVTPNGLLALRHHSLVTFRFTGVDSLQVSEFNNQNALWSLDIEDIRARQLELLAYEVSFSPSFGMNATFLCRTAEVLAVRKWDPDTRSPAA